MVPYISLVLTLFKMWPCVN